MVMVLSASADGSAKMGALEWNVGFRYKNFLPLDLGCKVPYSYRVALLILVRTTIGSLQ